MNSLAVNSFDTVITYMLLQLLHGSQSLKNFTVIYKWKLVDFEFPTPEQKREAIENGTFIPKNVFIGGGIKVWENSIFITALRLKPGVPLCLTSARYDPLSTQAIKGQPLQAYPNWEMQTIGNCTAFQAVLSMEIDQYGRLWVIDSGRINIGTLKPIKVCPPKLVIIDLATNTTLKTHTFPEAVVSSNNAFLNDIVVGCKSRRHCYVYISNTGEKSIVVYSFLEDKSWSLVHPTMIQDPAAINCTTKGVTFSLGIAPAINGIALAPRKHKYNRVYYSPLASYNMYSVSTKVLKKASRGRVNEISDDHITNHGQINSQKAGLAVDSGGYLYHGKLANNSLAVWDTREDFHKEQVYRHSSRHLEFIDGLCFDNRGSVLVATDKLDVFLSSGYDPNKYNFRIVRIPAVNKNKSYMY